MVNHTTTNRDMGYTLEPNQGYGESHKNNRDMGYNTLEPNQGYGESHNNNRDMGYNTLEPNQGYGESHNNNRETWVTTLQNQIESHNNKQRHGLHSRTKVMVGSSSLSYGTHRSS